LITFDKRGDTKFMPVMHIYLLRVAFSLKLTSMCI